MTACIQVFQQIMPELKTMHNERNLTHVNFPKHIGRTIRSVIHLGMLTANVWTAIAIETCSSIAAYRLLKTIIKLIKTGYLIPVEVQLVKLDIVAQDDTVFGQKGARHIQFAKYIPLVKVRVGVIDYQFFQLCSPHPKLANLMPFFQFQFFQICQNV